MHCQLKSFFTKFRPLSKFNIYGAISLQAINNNLTFQGSKNGFSNVSCRSNCQLVAQYSKRWILQETLISSRWSYIRLMSARVKPIRREPRWWTAFEKLHSKQITLAYFEDLEKRVLEENLLAKPHFFSNTVMLKLYNFQMLDAGMCFMEYLTQKGDEIPLITRISYIGLLGVTNIDHKNDDLIYSEYEKCEEINSSLLLQYIIEGFASTKQWKKSLDLLKEAVESSDDFSNYQSYFPVLIAVLKNGDLQTFESLFHSVCMKFHNHPTLSTQFSKNMQKVFHEFLDTLEKRPKGTTIYKLLDLLKHYDVWPDQSVTERMKEYFERTYRYKVSWSLANSWGQCKNCQMKLDDIELTIEEFEELKNSFLDHTLNKGDHYYWSNPDEMNKFKDFLDFHQFDVVIDSLNVSHAWKSMSKGEALRRVVNKFAKRNKKVLVIARKHLITKLHNAEVFSVENTSNDDFFLIFATLNSGPSCMFVTKDYLRQSKHQLGEKTGAIFQKWQRSRQIMVQGLNYQGAPILDWPSNYNARPQATENGCHIPFLSSLKAPEGFKLPRTILCVEYNKSRKNF